MTQNSGITFGDLSENEFERIRSLSNSVQEHFRKVRNEATASAENFQINANPAEIDELIDASAISTNSNNNSDQQNSLEVRESFQSIPSDEEDIVN